MSNVSIRAFQHNVFASSFLLEGREIRKTELHFMSEEDANFWIEYVILTLGTTPFYNGEELFGFFVKGSVQDWLASAVDVSMSSEEEDCEIFLSGAEKDIFFYFSSRGEKRTWIHSNLKKLTSVSV